MRGLRTRPATPTRRSSEWPLPRSARPLARPGMPASLKRGRCAIDVSHREKEDWLTKRELAAHLKMTTRWIEYQQRLGLPVLRLGAANRYKVSEVEAWLRERYHSIDPAGRF
jgi:hypothetical protein